MTEKQLRRWTRRIAEDIGGHGRHGRPASGLTVMQKTLLRHAAILQQTIEDLAHDTSKDGVAARLSAIRSFGRTVDRMRVRSRRRYERD